MGHQPSLPSVLSQGPAQLCGPSSETQKSSSEHLQLHISPNLQPHPAQTLSPCRGQSARDRLGTLTAPLVWGTPDLLPSAAKLGSVQALRAASPRVLGRLAGGLAVHSRRYNAALAALCRQGGRSLQKEAAVQVRQSCVEALRRSDAEPVAKPGS